MNERKVLNIDILEAALKVQVNIFELQYLISPLRNPSARLYLLLKRTRDKFFNLTESGNFEARYVCWFGFVRLTLGPIAYQRI